MLLGGDPTTNNGRSVVSISDGPGRLFNHGPTGTGPLYHHWTVSRANCGYISLSLQPAHRNDRPLCCTTSTETQRQGWGENIPLTKGRKMQKERNQTVTGHIDLSVQNRLDVLEIAEFCDIKSHNINRKEPLSLWTNMTLCRIVLVLSVKIVLSNHSARNTG